MAHADPADHEPTDEAATTPQATSSAKPKNKGGRPKNGTAMPDSGPAPDREPWERQPGEGDRQWHGFVAYRDMGEGERSVGAAMRILGEWTTQGGRWRTQWRWDMRCESYDRHVDDRRRKAYIKEVEDMAKRHAGLANAALHSLQAPIAELIKRINAQAVDLKTMSDRELLAFVRQAATPIKELVSVERVSRGVPTDATVVGSVTGPAGAAPKSLAEAIDSALRGAGYATSGADHAGPIAGLAEVDGVDSPPK